MAMASTRPLPSIDEPDTGAFWQATKRHELTYNRCAACDLLVFYPRKCCPRCGTVTSQHVSSGRGKIYSVTIVRRNGDPLWRERLPYSIALIDLEEGLRIMSEVVEVDERPVPIGAQVEIEWEDHGEVSIPLFRVVTR